MREFYAAIKKQLADQVPEINNIDWYLKQERKPGEIVDTPMAFIQLFPIQWEVHGKDIQRGLLRYRVHLISQTAYGDENDMLDTTNIDHLNIEKSIYVALNGFSADIRFIIPEVTDLLNAQLMNSSIRKLQSVHDEQAEKIHTYQEFTCTVYDHNAIPACQEVLAELDLTVMMVKSLN